MTKVPPEALRVFQSQFANALRNAEGEPTENTDLPARQFGVYKALVTNNVRGFIDRCFPVARSLIDEEQWNALNVDFFAHHCCTAPVFQDIPRQFWEYLQRRSPPLTPPWLTDLLHYEWLELAADTHTAQVPPSAGHITDTSQLTLNPTLFHCVYEWPVHTIGTHQADPLPEKTHMLVYRNHGDQVKFIAVNALTFNLIELLDQQPRLRLTDLITKLAEAHPQLELSTLQQFGPPLIEDLVAQNAILAIPCA